MENTETATNDLISSFYSFIKKYDDILNSYEMNITKLKSKDNEYYINNFDNNIFDKKLLHNMYYIMNKIYNLDSELNFNIISKIEGLNIILEKEILDKTNKLNIINNDILNINNKLTDSIGIINTKFDEHNNNYILLENKINDLITKINKGINYDLLSYDNTQLFQQKIDLLSKIYKNKGYLQELQNISNIQVNDIQQLNELSANLNSTLHNLNATNNQFISNFIESYSSISNSTLNIKPLKSQYNQLQKSLMILDNTYNNKLEFFKNKAKLILNNE